MSSFEKLFTRMTNPYMVVFYFAIVVLLILCFDKPIADYFYLIDLRHQIPLLSFLTRFGLGVVYIPSFLGLALFFRYLFKNQKWEARAWFLFLCVVVPELICLVFKIFLGRARPALFLNKQIYGFYGLKWDPNFWSLPSGHTTTIMGVTLGLSILFPRYFYGLLLFGISVALSRVFLSHHYVSDVMVAAYLVLIELGILLKILQRRNWLIYTQVSSKC